MLPKNTIVAALTLADALASRSLAIHAKQNTVVYDLNRTTNSASLDSVAFPDIEKWDSFDANAYGGFIEHITFNYDNPTEHDKAIDGYTNDLRLAISSHLKFARNVVKPVVLEYAERLNAAIQQTTFPTAVDQFTIQVFDKPEVFTDAVFVESMRQYDDMNSYEPNADQQLKDWDNVNLLEYILTGDAEVDSAISSWYAETGAGDYYGKLIKQLTTTRIIERPVSLYEQSNYLLFGYLLNRAIYEKSDQFAISEGSSLNQYQIVAGIYRNYCGVLLVKLIKHLGMLSKGNILIIEALSSAKKITVNGEVYRKWLANGGSTETLYALLVTNSNAKTVAQIEPLMEALGKEWNNYRLFWENSQSNNRLEIIRNQARLVFCELLKDLSEEEKEYLKTNNNFYTQVDKLLERHIAALKLSDLNDIYGLALRIVCNSRFFYTDAEFILSEMVEIAKNNPDMKPEEAALIATIHYLVDYLCDQLYVTTQV